MPLISASRQAASRPSPSHAARAHPAAPLAPQEWRGARSGLPLYLRTQLPVSQPNDPAEREADGVADAIMRMSAPAAVPSGRSSPDTAANRHSAHVGHARTIQRAPGVPAGAPSGGAAATSPGSRGGNALGASMRAFMEPRFGADFSGVRIHAGTDAMQMNRALGAQAFTVGQDIYYGSPSGTANMALTAHELAHVVQQTSGSYRPSIQREIAPTHDLPQGIFHVDSRANNAPAGSTRASLSIRIEFEPKTDAPYSNQIGLIQIVRDVNSDTGENVEPQSLPAARAAHLRTRSTDGAGVDAGFFTDVLHNDAPAHGGAGTDARAGSALPLQYPFGNDPPQPNPATPGLSRPFSSGANGAIIGYKRSDDPADIKSAEITDRPGSSGERNFDFETVAKGEDTLNVFGALQWGFEIRAGQIQNEHASASGAQTATFEAALERHRDFYVHEPVIFYFDFDSDVLGADEESKIDTFIDYLARFPDVRVTPSGFADSAGGNSAYNLNLSLRRAQAVHDALIAKGVPAAQISGSRRAGATQRFTPDAVTDQDLDANRRGNRRVVLTFRHVPQRGRRAP